MDSFIEVRLELFKVVVQEYHEAFKRSMELRRDHGFFLCGQVCDFLQQFLRRVIEQTDSRVESDWAKLSSFDFVVKELLSVPNFMQKTKFRAEALKVAKCTIDQERDRGKKTKADIVAETVMGEAFNPSLTRRGITCRYVTKVLLKHRSFKSDLVVELACFESNVLFRLKKLQATDCHRRLFQSFIPHSWLSRELQNVHMDILEFMDVTRHVYLDEFGTGHAFEDMVSLLSSCLELSRGNVPCTSSNFAVCAWVMLSQVCLKLKSDLVEWAQSI